MKALTICQPYASLIASGEKWVENRNWLTAHRGPMAIHAGQSKQWLRTWELPLPNPMPFGVIVAVADLFFCVRKVRLEQIVRQGSVPHYLRDQYPSILKCREILAHKHAEGPALWCLRNVRRLPRPVPVRGGQGLWDTPMEAFQEVVKQIAELDRTEPAVESQAFADTVQR